MSGYKNSPDADIRFIFELIFINIVPVIYSISELIMTNIIFLKRDCKYVALFGLIFNVGAIVKERATEMPSLYFNLDMP